MMRLFSGVSALVVASVAGLATAQAETRTITFLFTDDDQGYVQRMSELSKEFETANPGVKINFVSSGYDAVSKQLPVQLAVGEGPDIAKITDWQLAPYYLDMRPYMKDAEAFAKLHGSSLNQLRLPNVNDPQSINGYMASQTLNLPFVNKTLFEQAGNPCPAQPRNSARSSRLPPVSPRRRACRSLHHGPFRPPLLRRRLCLWRDLCEGRQVQLPGRRGEKIYRRYLFMDAEWQLPKEMWVRPAVRSTRTWVTSSSTAMS